MKIGWIGTGVMGASMVKRLIEANHQLSIWTRTKAKAAELIDFGASWCDTAADVAAASDVICTMVGYPTDVENVYFGQAGVFESVRTGHTLIDFTSSRPELAQRISSEAALRGAIALDAPVSGGDIGAKNGTLSIMVGGDAETFEAMNDLWKPISKTLVLQGGPGAGQQTKLTNQILVASSMIGVSEALVFAKRAGLNLEHVLQSVSSGAASSWALVNLGPRMLVSDFKPGFYVEHFVKDLGIALQECKRLDLNLPGLKVAFELYSALQAEGFGKSGTQAIVGTIARNNDIDW
jgi:3-hydroxyisobutyrate dehydrogenase